MGGFNDTDKFFMIDKDIPLINLTHLNPIIIVALLIHLSYR